MNIFIQISNSPRTRARFSENQSAPRLENRKISRCSPCASNLLHVLLSRIVGQHNLCSPTQLLKKYKSRALVTQQALINLHTRISKTTKIASIETALMEFHLARTPASNISNYLYDSSKKASINVTSLFLLAKKYHRLFIHICLWNKIKFAQYLYEKP